MQQRCEGCGKPIDFRYPRRMAREMKGWVVPRDQGGANHLRKAVPTGRYAHVDCLTAGEVDRQIPMFHLD
jgi:hypothetical protein